MTTLSATARPTLTGELTIVLRQVTELARTGWRYVRAPGASWRLAILAMWAIGVAGDAYTTLSMMATGMFEEANPVAAAGMAVITPAGYTALVCVWCAVLAVVSVGRPTHLYGRLLVGALAFCGAAKVYIAIANAALWMSV